MAFLLANWRLIAVILLALLLSHCCYQAGDSHRDAIWQAKWQAHAAADAKAQADAQAHARQVEQGWADAMDATAATLIQEKEDAIAHRDRLLAAARSGGLRLQSACPASVPEAASGSPGPDAAAGGALPRPAGSSSELVEFLIGEAARADQIAAQLRALQEASRAVR